ncbi:MAG: hypothetical protein WEA56_10830 [Balneolaceae bacterium]
MAQSKTTTDHNTIRKWAEERDGKPAVVTNDDDETGLLRINFPGFAEENLKDIDWERWFEIFDKNNLALVYQEETKDGEKSNFNKIVDRDKA